jgi:putative LysE/RhtB family amino acid efflux pump
MAMLILFLKSLIIGLAVAAPMGPIGILIVRRTLVRGFAGGLEGGAGVAVADSTYAAMAAFGLTAVTALLVDAQLWLQLGGGLVLLWLGWRILRRPVPEAGADEASVGGGFFTLFALTLANPATILSFVAIFASLGPLTAGDDWLGAAVMTLGVFLGSLLWWIVLVGGVSLMRKRLSAGVMRWLNLGSGCLIMVFGMVALVVGIDTWT